MHADPVHMNAESHTSTTQIASLVWWERYPATPRSVARARHAVADALGGCGVARGDVETALLVVSELVTNAVRHGLVPGRLVELRLTYDLGKTVTVEVSDAGDGRPPRGTAPPVLPDDDAESGRGLALVAAFADAWGVEDRIVGKTV
jgi:anti-sigma regulatory factor (Ser/Thr protein kinase)